MEAFFIFQIYIYIYMDTILDIWKLYFIYLLFLKLRIIEDFVVRNQRSLFQDKL